EGCQCYAGFYGIECQISLSGLEMLKNPSILFGILGLTVCFIGAAFGPCGFALGFCVLMKQKPRYKISTSRLRPIPVNRERHSSSERDSLISPEREFHERVISGGTREDLDSMIPREDTYEEFEF